VQSSEYTYRKCWNSDDVSRKSQGIRFRRAAPYLMRERHCRGGEEGTEFVYSFQASGVCLLRDSIVPPPPAGREKSNSPDREKRTFPWPASFVIPRVDDNWYLSTSVPAPANFAFIRLSVSLCGSAWRILRRHYSLPPFRVGIRRLCLSWQE